MEVTLGSYPGLRHTGWRRSMTAVHSHSTTTRYGAIVGVRTVNAEEGCNSQTCDLRILKPRWWQAEDAGTRRQEGHVPEPKQGQIVRPLGTVRHRHGKQLNMLHATRDMRDRLSLCTYRSIDEERCTTRLWPWYAFSACWQKAPPPGTITLSPPYHASRIEDWTITRKPRLSISNTILCVNRLLLVTSTASTLSPRISHVNLSQIRSHQS